MTQIALFRAAIAMLASSALLTGTTPAAAADTPAKAKPAHLACDTSVSGGLSYTVLTPGKGERPGPDAKVKVNYKGGLASDGSEFDAGEGIEFKVGGVIPGFGQGLQLMQPGGRYRLCIPSALGYGEAGTGPIPGNADLVFEVDLLSFASPPPKPILPLAERSCDQNTASGLGYRVITAGSGAKPSDADITLVDFATFDAASGQTLDQREWEKIPVAKTAPIFVELLKLMSVGSRYTFCPPKASPDDTATPSINISVTLIDIRLAPPEW
jgi:FKBP-type peptidyl-prolyl cis-trans isomerase FkpA